MNKYKSILNLILIGGMFFTACTPKTQQTIQPKENLTVSLIYPTQTTEIEMGQPFKGIIKVLDSKGNVVKDAKVNLSILDAAGKLVTTIPSDFGSGDVYRTETWTIPHKEQEGLWKLTVDAQTGTAQGKGSGQFTVQGSTSEILLNKYGFWIDSPAMQGINPTLTKERGDAQDGMIIWGGARPAQHVFPESWLAIHWHAGKFNLKTADDVREFMLGTIGDFGTSPVRDLGPFAQVKFKNWDAWQGKSRGLYSRYDEQWMIFYSPEMDKTYAIGTTVVLPPKGMDAHAHLRESFEVHPEVHAKGVAPEPLPKLLRAPELVSPKLGERFFGTKQPIVLTWKPLKELASDEYYLVSVDYNYEEANPEIDYTTRDTQFTLPESLYHLPNCGVFNWQVTLMQQTGVGKDGQLQGKPLSFSSLYWYVQWSYPMGEEAPFKPLCPNAQF